MRLTENLSEEANWKWPMVIYWSRYRLCDLTLKGEGCDPNMLRAQYLKTSWRITGQSAVRQFSRIS